METQRELYAQGLTSMPSDRNLSAPSWAANNGWDGVGLWVTLPIAALKKVVGGLTVTSSPGAQFTLLVLKCGQTPEGKKKFFTLLEHLLFNVIFIRDKGYATLEFYGGTLELGSTGQYYIAGMFGIKFEYNMQLRTTKFTGKLVLQGFMSQMSLAGGGDWVEPFETPSKLALSTAEVTVGEDPDLDDYLAKPEKASERRPSSRSSRGLSTYFKRPTKT